MTKLPEIAWVPLQIRNPDRRWWQWWKPRQIWNPDIDLGRLIRETDEILADLAGQEQ